MLSMIFLQILVRNWPVKYQNHLKHLKHINKVNAIMNYKPLSINELKEALFSLKINKSSGVDNVSFNIIKECFGMFCEPLIYLFQVSLEKGDISR